jgi:hypothetical protein
LFDRRGQKQSRNLMAERPIEYKDASRDIVIHLGTIIMTWRSWWQRLRSWHDRRPPADSSAQDMSHAIFERKSPPIRRSTLADDDNLREQVEFAAGEVLESLGVRARLLDRDHLIKLALRLNDRSIRERREGRLRLAEALCLRALGVLDNTVVPEHAAMAPVLENYAALLDADGRSSEATDVAARAAAIRARQTDTRIRAAPDSWFEDAP